MSKTWLCRRWEVQVFRPYKALIGPRLRARGFAAQQTEAAYFVAYTKASAVEPTRDRDALDALAWIESGMPDEEVGYGPDAPQLMPEQLQEFEPASYVHAPEAAPTRGRAVRGK